MFVWPLVAYVAAVTTPPQDPNATPPPGYGTQPGYFGTPPGYGTPPGSGQPPGQYGYGQAPDQYGYGQPAARTESKAVVALVLAITSFLVLPVFPAIAALIFASMARRDIDASGGQLVGAGLVTAAKVIAWIHLVLGVLVLVMLVAFVIATGEVTLFRTAFGS